MYGETMAILTVLSFALSFVLARRIENYFTPMFQNTIRSLVGLITFFIITIAFGVLLRLFLLPLILIFMLMLSIFFNVILGDTVYLHTQKILGPAKALAIGNTSPFFTFLFAALFLTRPITIQMIFSGILIGIGVVIMSRGVNTSKTIRSENVTKKHEKILNEDNSMNTIKRIKGVLLALFASISWAIGFAISDYSFNQVNQILELGILGTMLAMVVRFMFASVMLSSIAFIETRKKSYISVSKNRITWGILILSAILSYSLGSIFFGEAIHVVGASFMSLISTAMPLFTIPFSYIINKEKISKNGLLGVIITIFGVFLILI
ncbi:MAG: DMT family transporter [Promethearchaeota archaeon]|jgi:drug/metabolite transporter (DMT)-like permease